MNLNEVRKQLVKLSGRYDLIVDDAEYKDDGADFFITAGQKFLDGLVETPSRDKEYSITINSGQYRFPFTDIRALKEVSIEDNNGIRVLEKITFKKLRELYGYETNFVNVTSGIPEAYALGYMRSGISNEFTEGGKALFIMPPANGTFTLRIYATYFSSELVNEKDVNFWSMFHPDLLIQAALYKIEVFHRNTTGARDYLADLQQSVQFIEFDKIEEEIAGVDQLDNYWNFRNALPTKSYQHGYRTQTG